MPIIPDSHILESKLSRNVTDTNELDSTLQRGVTVEVMLESTLSRTIEGTDADVDPDVERTYNSFMNKAAMNKVQYDVLNQDLSKNPYFDQFLDDLDNTALRTRNQTIIKAINEIFTDQKKNFNAVYNNMLKFNAVIGDLTIDKELKEKYRKLGAKNIYTALVQLDGTITAINDFVKGNEEDMQRWDAMGYSSIVDNLNGISPSVRRIADLIANLSDEELAAIFSSETADVKEAIENLQNQINGLDEQFTQALQNVAETAHREVVEAHTDIINRIGKWGTLSDSELTVMLQALDVEKTESSDGVQVVHTIVDKYHNLLVEFAKIEREIEEAIGSMGAWGNMTTEKAAEMLLALGIVKEDPTGVDVLENVIAYFCNILDEIDTFQASINEVKDIAEADAEKVARLEQEFTTFSQYITERFQILTNEVYALLGAWGQLTHEQAKEIIESLGEPASDNATGIEVIQTLGRKYVALNDKMDEFAAHVDELVSSLVDDYCDPKLEAMAEAIARNFDDFKGEVHEQIEYILSAIDGSETGEAVYEALKAYIDTELFKRDRRIVDLNNRVSSVEIIVDAVEAANKKVVEKVDTFEEKIDSFESLLNAISDKQKSDEDRITSIEEILDNIPGDTDAKLKNLEQRVDKAEEDIGKTASDLDEYESSNDERVSKVETDLTNASERLEQEITGLDNRITEVEEEIVGNQKEINDQVNQRLTNVETHLDGVDTTLDSHESELDNHEDRIEALETGSAIADEVNNRLTTLESVADVVLTQDMIASERDIRNLFEKDREGD